MYTWDKLVPKKNKTYRNTIAEYVAILCQYFF